MLWTMPLRSSCFCSYCQPNVGAAWSAYSMIAGARSLFSSSTAARQPTTHAHSGSTTRRTMRISIPGSFNENAGRFTPHKYSRRNIRRELLARQLDRAGVEWFGTLRHGDLVLRFLG